MFWYNLFKSGEGDYRTRHAACPVLVGSKWGELKFYLDDSNCASQCMNNELYLLLFVCHCVQQCASFTQCSPPVYVAILTLSHFDVC